MARFSLQLAPLFVGTAAIASFGGARANSVSYTYDALGRLIQTFDASGYRDKYTIDAADNRSNVEVRNVVFQLHANQSVKSPDGRFTLIMQTDGNLVLYGPAGALWGSGTNGTDATFAAMQADGNLVVYNSSAVARWNSGTGGNPAAELDVQNDGNVVIYTGPGTPIWSTGTGGH